MQRADRPFCADLFYAIIARMDFVRVGSAAQWNAALASIPNAHVLQTWEWGEVKSKVGWTAERLVFAENGRPRAAAQILRRTLPRTPFGVMYVPKGPALDYQYTDLLGIVLGHLEEHARRSRAIFVKADPDIPSDAPAAHCLTERGWRVSAEQIQYRNTVVLDLARSEGEIFEAMKPKWRYNIRLAEKRGVRVEAGNEADLPVFYRLYAETGARDGFLVRQFPYYREVWGRMLRGDLARVLFARVGSETIAGLMLFVFSGRAWFFYGASAGKLRELMPNHLLQWEAIRWAKWHGCREYDFWGAPDHLAEGEPMYGVYKFKMGFGGRLVERIPAHDFVTGSLLHWLYRAVRPKYLARLRGKHKTLVGTE
jgi:lipid II:glycine glycyltransferase (peptidoglycan interpeptide bridge formation enzyme)